MRGQTKNKATKKIGCFMNSLKTNDYVWLLPQPIFNNCILSKMKQKYNGQIDPDLIGIDDAQVYNYALTATQVKLLYNNGSINFGPVTRSP